MIQDKINADMKAAMLAKDAVKLSVVRGFKAAFTNELVAKGRKPTDTLTDDEALAVIARAAKQRKDSIEQFTKGGRTDLADAEKAELAVIESYLPQMMSRDDIRPLAVAKKAELGIADGDKSAAGKLMSGLMKDLKGKADGADVKAVVESLLG